MQKKTFQFRAVQLDLARQMETIDFIFEFIDSIEKSGFNTLVLYLEGRIKTKSFPYPAKGEYYTPEEMKKVVDYAEQKKIDVVPVVSVLGHAEHFLKHQELKHLSEIRGDAQSPLEEHINHVFCPSLPETFDFIKKYLAEITAIFPSKYLHLGCDEVWNFGCCDICRNRVYNGETCADIFGKYLIKIHSFVTKKLNRKMMIWDDLFECYPSALETLPRDIILCCWQYDQCVDIPKAHFKSRLEEDLLMKYEKMGFDYIFAPATYYASNIESLTDYALKHSPLGGLLTVWEKSLSFMHEIMPLIHYSGSLWSGEECSFDKAMSEVFKCDDRLFLNTLRSYYEIRLTHPTRLSPESYLAGPLTEFEGVIKSSCATNTEVFKTYIDKFHDRNSKNIIEDMLVSLKWKAIMFKLRTVLEELYSFGEKCPNTLRRKEISTEAVEMIDDFIKIKLDQWKRFRQGISSAKTEKRFHDFREKILKLAESSEKAAGVLKVKFFLPDMFNAQKCSFTIQFEDGSSEKIANGIYKNYELNDAYFILKFPYYTNKKPISIKLDSWLYGGMGFAYLELISMQGSFIPVSIQNVIGNVQNPQHTLVNDLRFCYVGEINMDELFEIPELTKRRHGLTILLERNNFDFGI